MKILTFSIFVFFAVSAPSIAGEYKVSVTPEKPSGESRNAICSDRNNICFMTIPFLSADRNQEEYMNIAMRLLGQVFEADFMLKGYQLSLSEKEMTHFKIGVDQLAQPQKLHLFFPNSDARNKKIAEIELSVTPISD